MFRWRSKALACFAILSTCIVPRVSIAQATCPEPGATTVFYANGITTTTREARRSVDVLQAAVLGPSGQPGNIEFRRAFNPSNGITEDLIESARQAIDSHGGWPTFWQWYQGLVVPEADAEYFRTLALAFVGVRSRFIDTEGVLERHVGLYRAQLGAGRKVVVVAHSQGNFFANAAVERSGENLTPSERSSFTIVSVANPDDHIATSTRSPVNITLNEDLVIFAISEARVAAGLAASMGPTVTNMPGMNDDPTGHNFTNTYMQWTYRPSDPRSSRLRIVDAVHAAIAATPAPPCVPGPSFDFAMRFFTVDGNILGRGTVDFSDDFVDAFDDGSLTSPPTSAFFFSQGLNRTTESGGFLRFRSADGSRTGTRFGATFLEDLAFLNHLLTDGGGNSLVTAAFRADVPSAGQYYAMGIQNAGSPLLESVAISVVLFEGRPWVIVNNHTGTILASDPVALPAAGFILFRLSVDDSANRVVASYSIDNGSTFRSADRFRFFSRHGTIFNFTPGAAVFVQGGIRGP